MCSDEDSLVFLLQATHVGLEELREQVPSLWKEAEALAQLKARNYQT